MYNPSIDDLMSKPLKDNVSVFDYQVQSSSGKVMTTFKNNVFSFLLEGSKSIYYGKEYEKVESNQFVMLTAGQCIMTEKTSESNLYRSVLLFCDNTVLNRFIKNNNISIPNSATSPFFVVKYDEYLLSFANSLLRTDSIADIYLPSFLENKLHELLYYLVSKIGPSFLYSFLTTPVSAHEHFREMIEKNSLAKLSIEELAFLNNMSLSTFKRTFTRVYNTSPGKWFLKQRLQFAADLLLQDDKRPTEIYEELGFESLSSFTQAFKSQYGTTPRQFKA